MHRDDAAPEPDADDGDSAAADRDPAAAEPRRDSAEGARPSFAAARGIAALKLVDRAALGVLVALVLGRAITPQLRGLVVGTDAIVVWVERIGAFYTQLAAMGVEVIAIAATLAFAVASVRASLRAVGVAACACVVLLTLSSSVQPIPQSAALVAAGLAAAVAVGGAVAAHATPYTRGAARAVLAAAIAAAARAGAIALALRGPSWSTASRVLATVALVVEVAALLAALAASSRRPVAPADRESGPQALVDPLLVLVLGLALLGVRGALQDPGDVGAFGELVRRAAAVLTSHPLAYGPFVFGVFVGITAPLFAALALARRRLGKPPAAAGAIALALLAASTPEVPLASVSLVVAGLALVLVSRDPQALWRALEAGGASTGPAPEARASASSRGSSDRATG
jgi:hypothetical protein